MAIEGIDGAGKTTQAELLTKRLSQRGLDTAMLHEPTDSEWGQKIRDLAHNGRTAAPRVELEYFINDRRWDVTNRIEPALKRGAIIVMDRYYLSNVAYQGALKISVSEIFDLNSFAPAPDLILVLDISPTIGLRRVKKRENGRPNHFEDPNYLKEVRAIFKSLESLLPTVSIVDASRSIGEVHDNIWNIVADFLRPRLEGLL